MHPDPRRAAEFSGQQHQHPLVQASILQVLDQRCDRLVHQRPASLHRAEDVCAAGMVVPAVVPGARRLEADTDHADARFDQPTGQQGLLTGLVHSVPSSQLGVFA